MELIDDSQQVDETRKKIRKQFYNPDYYRCQEDSPPTLPLIVNDENTVKYTK